MQVRAARNDDLPAIAECARIAFPSSHPGLTDQAAEPHGELARQIRQDAIFVIEDDAELLGYISFSAVADHIFVESIAVLPQHRCRGAGSRLLACAEKAAPRLGLRSVKLFTDATVEGNVDFYLRRGYRETGRCEHEDFARVYYTKMASRREPAAVALAT